MLAVKGITMKDYRMECKEEGGEVFEFKTIRQAAKYLAEMTGITEQQAEEGILNDTNCDWVLFGNHKVYFRYYGSGSYNEEVIDRMRTEGKRV